MERGKGLGGKSYEVSILAAETFPFNREPITDLLGEAKLQGSMRDLGSDVLSY